MSHARPEPGCQEIELAPPCRLDEPSEVSLEDYARTLARARGAEAVRSEGDPALVRAVHVCGGEAPLGPAARRDLVDFARSMVAGTGGGLGWS
jgi:hypothetical protein